MIQQYEIVIRGYLPSQWIDLFEGMEIRCLPDGITAITGCLPDQSALYGLIMRLRDLGISLISVNAVQTEEP